MRKFCFSLGILGPVLFLILSGLAISLSGFNAFSNPGSNVVATQYGWLQNAAFIIGGLGIFLLGCSLSLSQKKTAVAPYLVMFFGLTFVLEYFFPSNPTQTDAATRVHILLFALATIGMIISALVFGSTLRKINTVMSAYCFLTAVISGIGFVGIFFTQGSVGLFQQITIFPLLLWCEVVVIYVFRNSLRLQ